MMTRSVAEECGLQDRDGFKHVLSCYTAEIRLKRNTLNLHNVMHFKGKQKRDMYRMGLYFI